jgi:DNA modification methylase
VKPTDLMRHLVRLVTPQGGTVLDCFAGSGSTLIAAEMEGFAWIGIEKEPEYVAIAEARLNGTQRGMGLIA